jgi:hypothetical protein
MEYRYGMRLRGFSIGCQPMNGFVCRVDDTTGKYHDILVYDRQLNELGVYAYSLDELTWFAVQEDSTDAWDNGTYNYEKAVQMLLEQGHGLIAVIDREHDYCVQEITYDEVKGE